jgi:hypothetical protein
MSAGDLVYEPGEVVVFWTAPGDDDMSGFAAGYDIRYQPHASGPIDTDQEWQLAVQAAGEPQPSPPGRSDSLLIDGLDFGAGYYFCLKTYDDMSNYSGMSNSPLIVSGDTTGYDYEVGDVNNNGDVNGADVTYLVAYFKGMNPPPENIMSADTNGDCMISGADVTYLVRFFKGGPPPIRGDC